MNEINLHRAAFDDALELVPRACLNAAALLKRENGFLNPLEIAAGRGTLHQIPGPLCRELLILYPDELNETITAAVRLRVRLAKNE